MACFIELRLGRDDIHGTDRGVSAVKRPLGPTQHLQPFEVVHERHRGLRSRLIDTVDVQAHRRVGDLLEVGRTDAAQREFDLVLGLVERYKKVRDQLGEITAILDAFPDQRLLVYGGHDDRCIHQIGLTTRCGDDDLFQNHAVLRENRGHPHGLRRDSETDNCCADHLRTLPGTSLLRRKLSDSAVNSYRIIKIDNVVNFLADFVKSRNRTVCGISQSRKSSAAGAATALTSAEEIGQREILIRKQRH